MKTKILHLFVALLLVSSYAHAEEDSAAYWEFKVWVQPDGMPPISRSSDIEKELNRLGAKGWELVSVVWKKHSDNTSPTGRMIYYFKRSVKAKISSLNVDHPKYKMLTLEEALRRSSSTWRPKVKPKKVAEQGAASDR